LSKRAQAAFVTTLNALPPIDMPQRVAGQFDGQNLAVVELQGGQLAIDHAEDVQDIIIQGRGRSHLHRGSRPRRQKTAVGKNPGAAIVIRRKRWLGTMSSVYGMIW
jgi:hypothetical protein